MSQKAVGGGVAAYRELSWGLLWSGFALGVAAAAALWLFIHSSNESLANAYTPYSLTTESLITDTKSKVPISAKVTENAAQHTIRDTKSTPSQQSHSSLPDDASQEPVISVYLSDKRKVETVPLETYVLGVLAAEMPLTFEQAALEAQALAARTYIVRRLLSDNRDGVPGNQAPVTDQVSHQAYKSLEQMDTLKETDPEGFRKARLAVARTRDTILTYKNEPIEALFFSSSNGYTENSEEVFPNKLPYLRAVSSPWEEESRHPAEETTTMPLVDFYEKLGIATLPAAGTKAEAKPQIRVLERTAGHRVKILLVGSEKRTGEEARDRLGLRSAAFDWTVEDGKISITTHGYGHGVGMSQWGAEGMAKKGKSARQIVEHYYTDVRLTEASKLLDLGNRNRRL
ncbi:MAG: stage II sporulation protein D [Cohnella sp.]|nr:stage II sporulation protein D [Cohnella sp.]